jgi:hypothetical protein
LPNDGKRWMNDDYGVRIGRAIGRMGAPLAPFNFSEAATKANSKT